MKFNIGEWVMKPGVESKNAEQIRAVYVSDDKTSVHLYAVTYREDYRGLDVKNYKDTDRSFYG